MAMKLMITLFLSQTRVSFIHYQFLFLSVFFFAARRGHSQWLIEKTELSQS
jgi:hypothetical protein